MNDFRDWGFWSLPLTEAQIVSTHVSRLSHLPSFREIVKPVASRNWSWCCFASNPSFKDVWRPSSRCWWRQAAQKYRPRWLLTAVRQTAILSKECLCQSFTALCKYSSMTQKIPCKAKSNYENALCVGHTAKAAEGCEGPSQAGPKPKVNYKSEPRDF